ncbi:MAG TPA: nuclear transport factor 2 family protein [Thermoanaerobaculia bacterium]|nr:nuclear transport factor 2 family protein [Thermoanaerobaculia bacterium]
MSEQANISKLQQMYAAFSRGDIQTIAGECTDDVSWGTDTVAQSEVPWYRIRSGRDGVIDFFTTLASEVDFEKFEPNLWAASGDQVLVRLDYTYRFKKNGKSASTSGIHTFSMRDGKVSQFRAYEDTAKVRDVYQ